MLNLPHPLFGKSAPPNKESDMFEELRNPVRFQESPDKEEHLPVQITLNFKVSVEMREESGYGPYHCVSVDGCYIGQISEMSYMDAQGSAGFHYNGNMFKSLSKAVDMVLLDWEASVRRQLR